MFEGRLCVGAVLDIGSSMGSGVGLEVSIVVTVLLAVTTLP